MYIYLCIDVGKPTFPKRKNINYINDVLIFIFVLFWHFNFFFFSIKCLKICSISVYMPSKLIKMLN